MLCTNANTSSWEPRIRGAAHERLLSSELCSHYVVWVLIATINGLTAECETLVVEVNHGHVVVVNPSNDGNMPHLM